MNKHDEHTNTCPLLFEKRVLNSRYWFLAESQQWNLTRGTRPRILEQNAHENVKFFFYNIMGIKFGK